MPPNVPKGETILLVEDEVQVRKIEALVLRREGYVVIEAESVASAVDAASATPPPIHLLLTDLVLPDGNGGEVAQRVQALHPETRALFVSGYTNNPEINRGISEGEFAFLPKPFAAESLRRRVREVLDSPVAQPASKSVAPER